MKKYKLLVLGNWSKLNTGFGGHKKRVLRWFHAHPDWEVVEAAAGLSWNAPECQKMPWKCYGVAPDAQQQAQINSIRDEGQRVIAQRNANYGIYKIQDVIKTEKPTHFYACEDSWAYDELVKHVWMENMPPVLHVTLDSLPLMPAQIDLAAKCDNLFPWAGFATEEYHKLGYKNIETLPGTVDPEDFFPLPEEKRNELRKKFNLQDTNVFLFLGRNQVRKHFPNVMDGFKIFKEKNPNTKAKLLFHCSFAESWNFPQLIKDKGLSHDDILTTYFCKACREWEIRSYAGEALNCPFCGHEKSFNTSNIEAGPSDKEISEIYGLSDLVINAVSSGGFELAVWQGKMCGKVTAVTSYSCGTDACYENSGGWPIDWNPYMEPGSQFIKSTSCPKSIARCMERVVKMDFIEKMNWGNKALDFAKGYCSTNAVCEKLDRILKNIPSATWDNFDWTPKLKNPQYIPADNLSNSEWIIDLYKNMLNDRCDKNTSYIQHWTAHLDKTGDRQGTLKHFQNVAAQQNNQVTQKTIDFSELLDPTDEKRLLVTMPESAGDVLMVSSIIPQIKNLYPEFRLYFATSPQFKELVEHLPEIHRILDFMPVMEDIFLMTGKSEHKGYFDIVMPLHVGSQRHPMVYQNRRNNFRAEWLK